MARFQYFEFSEEYFLFTINRTIIEMYPIAKNRLVTCNVTDQVQDVVFIYWRYSNMSAVVGIEMSVSIVGLLQIANQLKEFATDGLCILFKQYSRFY